MRYMNSPAIRVLVGKDPCAKEVFVHQDLICGRSIFFDNTMREPWKEADERKVTLSTSIPRLSRYIWSCST
jgi:hypothetical protein